MMETNKFAKWVLVLCMVVVLGAEFVQSGVSYDRKAVVINEQRRILISGSIHYPRSTPEVLNFINFLCFLKFFCQRMLILAVVMFVDVGGSDKQS